MSSSYSVSPLPPVGFGRRILRGFDIVVGGVDGPSDGLQHKFVSLQLFKPQI